MQHDKRQRVRTGRTGRGTASEPVRPGQDTRHLAENGACQASRNSALPARMASAPGTASDQ